MPQVAFHFNVESKLDYVCRLARKYVRQGSRLLITGRRDDLLQLDRMLWEMAPADFVAHCLGECGPELRTASAVLLSEEPAQRDQHDVLVNLGENVPAGFEAFERVVEIVSQGDEQDRAGARQRWRFYAAEGHPIVRHDLKAGEGTQ